MVVVVPRVNDPLKSKQQKPAQGGAVARLAPVQHLVLRDAVLRPPQVALHVAAHSLDYVRREFEAAVDAPASFVTYEFRRVLLLLLWITNFSKVLIFQKNND